MSQSYRPIIWKDDTLLLLDQRLLPQTETFVEVKDLKGCALAIKDMIVRGAPCIGFTAIYGMALWVKAQSSLTVASCRNACDEMISARPTAVNLSFEVNRCFEIMKNGLAENQSKEDLYKKLVAFGDLQIKESHEKNTAMAKIGFEELKKKVGDKKWRLMTHCNTGFLACGSLGTALGVISYANSQGQVEYVYADETRPYMQGTRLTAFELSKENIPYSIVVEGAASYLLSHNKVDAIFVGADRIAANGDTANKVGTSTLAIVAKHYNIPFYVVAPVSSFDVTIPDGSHIEIEMRPINEITELKGIKLAPEGANAVNPSFDVTDHQFITGIICEKGFINPKNPGELVRVVQS
ncbi:S-methyl-5-thioribose-1-phosphate isomerase [Peredibacter starrii]|uniref:S-methyl-5-thioribose-1-phosphate isomerase n=1 Tax=Peredibacter starrii TaxID=28202 RepID=A0AAX4HQH7_9BACT|nr:S-methyl-5-thioribose-1-phosphate isomerase [Peredibacter starrii]WPU65608.1 S-methyl-5-thioribose-1-phosphate isomerase [Peredibacter starrii]